MLSEQTRTIVKSTAPVLAEHGKTITTVFYRNMFEAHPELLNIFNQANQKQGRQQTALANTVYAAAVHIDNLEAILPAVVQIANKHVSLGVKAEHYPIVGEYLLKAIQEVLGDAATDEIINAWAEAYGVIADVFISIENGMYEKSETQENGWSFFKDFTIARKVKESDNITSFYLKPADGHNVPSYEAGQYITVRLAIPGEEFLFNRQYSLSQASRPDEFRISVKREADNDPNGLVSVYLHEQVEEGDTVEVSAPAGEFVLDVKRNTPVAFVSGGVGITPMMSMFETVATQTPERPVSFLHAARNETVHAFDKDIQQYVAAMDNAKYKTLYSDEPQGYITRELLEDMIDVNGEVYVCGPVPFMEKMISELRAIGMTDAQIHYEFFGPAVALQTV
ncbi:NO-inducible flavohemoprotein [Planococcus maritimus]|uniref:Flavohemoprotein n=1 Tax=Planococcus maritimus TaxID=192421 RepID=A0A7D7QV09_PLAMR|nr:NO-inducible flavohemoprotein [Planococcus maritimus]KYG59698.1 nitric oxide dioxygenase [Planococcus maritimus]OED33400.1 nitric oxide dioxygenase [Planococcus maritimus]QMT17034.1 NO-inducible flavohemoprotein [Planococcus maritimus]